MAASLVVHKAFGLWPAAQAWRAYSHFNRAAAFAGEATAINMTAKVSSISRIRHAGQVLLPPSLEVSLGKLSEALGGWERIAATPIPFTYAVIIHRTIYLYVLLLPFGLVDATGLMTPVVVAFVAYTFFALEALGAGIEEPFGTEPNDLALDAMSATIEATLREMVGEVPGPLSEMPPSFVQT